MLVTFKVWTHLIPVAAWWEGYCYVYFVSEDTEAWRGDLIYSGKIYSGKLSD